MSLSSSQPTEIAIAHTEHILSNHSDGTHGPILTNMLYNGHTLRLALLAGFSPQTPLSVRDDIPAEVSTATAMQ